MSETKMSNAQKTDQNKWLSPKQKRIAITIATLFSIPASILVMLGSPSIDPPATAQPAAAPMVGVVEVVPSSYQAQVKGYGEVRATFDVQLAAEVSGRVIQLEQGFASGQIVKAGELLLKLENSGYQQAYLAAQKSLTESEITLLQEQRTREQALDEWQRSGLKGKPDSPLVLNEPQVKAATLDVKQNKAAVLKAKRDLDNTQITAPFDGLVITRKVSPGSYLQTGNEIGTLYSANEVEIRILLSSHQWQLLPSEEKLTDDNSTIQITIFDSQNPDRFWKGRVLRVEKHIESETRQRALILSVKDPLQKGLLAGTFVQASISGKKLNNVLSLPASALSQQGEIWYVDQQNLLQRFKADPLFDAQGKTIIEAPANLSNLRILIRPLASYKPGMKVEAKQEQSL